MTSGTARRTSTGLIVAVVAVIVLGSIGLAVLVVGRPFSTPTTTRDPGALLAQAPDSIATAPGVGFALSFAAQPPQGMRMDVTGEVDLAAGRFHGTAKSGAPDQPLILFGGPSSGEVVLADGLFVRTENGPFERQPAGSEPLEHLIDRDRLAEGMRALLASVTVDPVTEIVDCAGSTCQVVRFNAPPKAVYALIGHLSGSDPGDPPADFGMTRVQATLDQATGFPILIESTATAGQTAISITLRLERRDPAPSIRSPLS